MDKSPNIKNIDPQIEEEEVEQKLRKAVNLFIDRIIENYNQTS